MDDIKPPSRGSLLHRLALEVGVVLMGLALGLGSLWWTLRGTAQLTSAAGPWQASLLAGSADADPWTRARVALGGLLALNRSETLYYVARHDSAGQPLRMRCHYRVQGKPPEARWWSVTPYAHDHFLIANTAQRYSIHGDHTRLDEQGRFSFITGPSPADEGTPWLPTPGDQGLLLTLRVYNPGPQLQADPSALQAPTIELVKACP